MTCKPCVSKFCIAVLAISAGSGFQHGYHTGITNIPTELFKKWIETVKTKDNTPAPTTNDVEFLWSLCVAMFSVGGILGGCLIGFLADRLGRRKSLFWNNLIIFIGILFMSFSKRVGFVEIFMFGRLLAGLNAGISAGICQIYLTEIAPTEIRGRIGSTYQLAVVTSILLAQIAGLFLKESWNHMLAIAVIPILLQILVLPFCPDSPKYLLMTKDKERRARRALTWFRGTDDVSEEMEEIKQEDTLVKQLHLLQRTSGSSRRSRIFWLSVVVHMGQQLCGINIIIYYSVQLTKKLHTSTPEYVSVGLTAVLTVSTLVTVFIVDKIGRKMLLLISFLTMAITTLILTILLAVSATSTDPTTPLHLKCIVLVGVIIYVAAFSLGAGPICWFYIAEIASYSDKSAAVVVGVVVHWASNLLVILIFGCLKVAIGPSAFMVFVILDIFFFCSVLTYLPETNQLTAREIIEMYIIK